MPTRENTTLLFYPLRNPSSRLLALWYFAGLLIVWNILGHTVLGFEQAWAHPLIGVASTLIFQIVLDWIDGWSYRREPRFLAGSHAWADFVPPAVITGLACTMLLYPNERVGPFIFATAVSVGSKVLLRAPVGDGRTQHFYNPSNLGVTLTLLLFPWVGFAPPYHFTRNLSGDWNWVVPAIIVLTGIFIHSRFTGRLPLCLAWIAGFVIQGVLRSWLFGNPWYVPLVPMTSAAFIVFTLYMIPDPATTPLNPKRQILFGLAVAFVYGVLQIMHIVFGLFIALALVCTFRGIGLYLLMELASLPRPGSAARAPAPAHAASD